MANPVTLAQAASFLTNDTLKWSAWGFRDSSQRPPGEGVNHQEHWRVMSRQAGANMTVDVGKTGVGLMEAWVRGDTRGGQGLYRVDNIARATPTSSAYVSQINVDVSNNAAANPRLDIVVLEVVDMEHIGGGTATAQVRVIAGTATVGATLDNRSGAPAVPSSALHLADILVPALESTSIDPGDIRDRRHWVPGSFPSVAGGVDRVGFVSPPSIPTVVFSYAHASHDLQQIAVLSWLPRRIEGANRINWKYTHGATATTGSYIFGIADASGTVIAGMSASASFTGAANSVQVRSESFTATTLEAGAYYVVFGVDSSAGGFFAYGLDSTNATTTLSAPGLMFRSATGGVTLPATINAFTDINSFGASSAITYCPFISLSAV